ncbi:glycosyltransferase family 4 protein [Hymenobacter sp. J193]|uniref:glycosyltransferase family 4 protein n=1 Tax=Hymenobacter sp. J193 TaxID=2898429 RepID=UPI0021508E53|nr:glycosyltransferase family 4 protein [Hymenobacter sp. J193]MCR5887056.1 glycosyltransferase family 4 protein [Hymenobacter sp. J193]
MRIAFISLMANAPWGGSEVLWSNTAAYALDQGHEVFFSAYEWPSPHTNINKLIQKGAVSYFRPHSTLKTRLINKLYKAAKVSSPEVAAIKKFKPDVILFNQGGAYTLRYWPELLAFAKENAIPYHLICHSYNEAVTFAEKQQKFIVSIFEGAVKVFTVSLQQKAIIERQLAHSITNNIQVANLLNLPAEYPISFPAATLDVPQLACIGSLTILAKGQDILFEALSSEKWKGRPWQLNLFGTGPDLDYLKRLALFYGIDDKVRFRGHVANMAAIWAECHLLIVPSRIDSGPMVVAEAMICGRPVVSTRVGIVPEWITPGDTGYIAEGTTSHALDQILEVAWNDRYNWQKIGQQASIFGADKMTASPIELFLDQLLTTEKL